MTSPPRSEPEAPAGGKPLLFRGCAVLSMDESIGDLPSADILVVDGRIERVGRPAPCPDATVIEAAGLIAMPGFVNAHVHAWQFPLRGVGADWLGRDYVENVHHNLATRFTADDIHLATLMCALNQLRMGTTTIVDWSHALRGAGMADAALDAHARAGARAVFVRGTAKPADRPYHEVPYPRDEVVRLRKGRLANDAGLVTLALGILGPDWSDYDVAVADIRLAREFGLMHSAHAFGRPGTRRTPDGYLRLAADGLLGPDHNIAHGNCFSDEELAAVLDAGCSITATPFAEMFTTERPAVLGRAARRGALPSLGSDMETHMNGSMLAVARHAFLHQREYDNRSLAAHGQWPARDGHATLARDALSWATIGGAKAFGLDSRIGSIAPGKQADLVFVDSRQLGMAPAAVSGDLAQSVLFYAEESDIRHVLIAGRFRKRGGRLLEDESCLRGWLDALHSTRLRLFEEAGFTPERRPRGTYPVLA